MWDRTLHWVVRKNTGISMELLPIIRVQGSVLHGLWIWRLRTSNLVDLISSCVWAMILLLAWWLGYGSPKTEHHCSLPGRDKRFRQKVRTGFETHSIFISVQYGGCFPGVKLPGSEAYHSPSYSAEVKNAWRCTSSSTCRYGVPRDNLSVNSPVQPIPYSQ